MFQSRGRSIALLPAVLVFAYGSCGAGTYYIDGSAGNDAADGLSAATAWRSLQRISAAEFHAGDHLLLKRGTKYTGTLCPKGSGGAEAPIFVDAYGEGPLPKIHADPGAEAALRLFNQEYWTIEHLELIGGEPRGVYISGTQGILHGIHLRGLIVHGVTGQPKDKEGGLLIVAPGSAGQRFDDVMIDGVTAYGTSQWAGILVGGVTHGFLPEQARSTNVTIRNSMVHDVAGDGIVLFQVNRGTIENSVAWHTGMQLTQTIGTPNAIWTWMCRRCAVRRCEAFLTDSPGVDGGAFDIDYGDDDNVVEESYGHDTQGYCVAIFGAGRVTTNSIVWRNVCAGNGSSPRLAAAQGAVYLSTWNGGKLKGVEISGNRIAWSPPVAAAAVVNNAEFDGSGTFAHNTIVSVVPGLVRGSGALKVENNSIRTQRLPFVRPAPTGPILSMMLKDAEGQVVTLGTQDGRWHLYGFVPRSGDSVAILSSAWRQFHRAGLDVLLIAPLDQAEQARHIRWNWNLGDIPVLFDNESGRAPSATLVDERGQVVWHCDGAIAPGALGEVLRASLGNPDYSQLISEP